MAKPTQNIPTTSTRSAATQCCQLPVSRVAAPRNPHHCFHLWKSGSWFAQITVSLKNRFHVLCSRQVAIRLHQFIWALKFKVPLPSFWLVFWLWASSYWQEHTYQKKKIKFISKNVNASAERHHDSQTEREPSFLVLNRKHSQGNKNLCIFTGMWKLIHTVVSLTNLRANTEEKKKDLLISISFPRSSFQTFCFMLWCCRCWTKPENSRLQGQCQDTSYSPVQQFGNSHLRTITIFVTPFLKQIHVQTLFLLCILLIYGQLRYTASWISFILQSCFHSFCSPPSNWIFSLPG